MLFWIRHDSSYRYDVPVCLGAHVLRLTPRTTGGASGGGGSLRLLEQRLHIEPEPSARWQEQDEHGNSLTHVSFTGSTSQLRVLSEVRLETLAEPPLALATSPLPWATGGFSSAPGGTLIDPSVQRFAESLARDVQGEPVAFLDHVTRTLFSSFDRRVRLVGAARPAAETLALREGACRDLTVLVLDACRHLGLSGRFVSGYQAQAETPDGQRHLHAWTEVFLPGLGWRGWDATHGLRAGEGHVALCAAPTQAATMPIDGGFTFQGAVVNSTLEHSVQIRTQ